MKLYISFFIICIIICGCCTSKDSTNESHLFDEYSVINQTIPQVGISLCLCNPAEYRIGVKNKSLFFDYENNNEDDSIAKKYIQEHSIDTTKVPIDRFKVEGIVDSLCSFSYDSYDTLPSVPIDFKRLNHPDLCIPVSYKEFKGKAHEEDLYFSISRVLFKENTNEAIYEIEQHGIFPFLGRIFCKRENGAWRVSQVKVISYAPKL